MKFKKNAILTCREEGVDLPADILVLPPLEGDSARYKHAQFLAPEGFSEMDNDEILSVLRCASKIGKHLEKHGWKVGY